jgi:hypothetical protein
VSLEAELKQLSKLQTSTAVAALAGDCADVSCVSVYVSVYASVSALMRVRACVRVRESVWACPSDGPFLVAIKHLLKRMEILYTECKFNKPNYPGISTCSVICLVTS